MFNEKIVTVDGPSGVGKGTLCRYLAKSLNYKLLDSGSIYRLLALHCVNNKINIDEESDVTESIKNINIKFILENENLYIFLDNKNVTKNIRFENIGKLASKLAAYPKVRENLLEVQRNFSSKDGLVGDGRDLGTVVFPNAKYKIFLDGSPEVRAKRRYDELRLKNIDISYDTIYNELYKRDYQDRNRKVAPLKPARDSFIVDTSNLDINEVRKIVLDFILKK